MINNWQYVFDSVKRVAHVFKNRSIVLVVLTQSHSENSKSLKLLWLTTFGGHKIDHLQKNLTRTLKDNRFMKLENIFDMKIFFGKMHSFYSFLSNKALKIVKEALK